MSRVQGLGFRIQGLECSATCSRSELEVWVLGCQGLGVGS